MWIVRIQNQSNFLTKIQYSITIDHFLLLLLLFLNIKNVRFNNNRICIESTTTHRLMGRYKRLSLNNSQRSPTDASWRIVFFIVFIFWIIGISYGKYIWEQKDNQKRTLVFVTVFINRTFDFFFFSRTVICAPVRYQRNTVKVSVKNSTESQNAFKLVAPYYLWGRHWAFDAITCNSAFLQTHYDER